MLHRREPAQVVITKRHSFAMTTILPEVVIGWIQSILNLEDFRLVELRRHGSHALKVTELKSISYEIDKQLSQYCLNNETSKEQLALFQERFHRPSSNSKKDSWVRYIQNCFFKNRLLGLVVPSDDVIWKALNITYSDGCDDDKSTQEVEEEPEQVVSNKKRRVQVDKEEKKKKNKATPSLGETLETAAGSTAAAAADVNSWDRYSSASPELNFQPQTNLNHHQSQQDNVMRTIANIHDRDNAHALSSSYMNGFNSLYANNRIGGLSYQMANSPEALLCHQLATNRPQHHQQHLMPMDNLGSLMISQAFLQNASRPSSILPVDRPRMIYSDANAFSSLPAGLQYNQTSSYLNQQSLMLDNTLISSLQRQRRALDSLPAFANSQNNLNLASTTLRGENENALQPPEPKVYPSKLAALAAHQVKIKKEKSENFLSSSHSSTATAIPFQAQEEMSSVPRSMLEKYVLNELHLIGFTNTTEVMIALRQVQQKYSQPNNHPKGPAGLAEETMLHIMESQRSSTNTDQKKANKIYNQPEAPTNDTAQEGKKSEYISEKILGNSSIEEIIGFEDDGNSGNSSVHFLSSFLLTSKAVKKVFRAMMLFDLSNSARDKVAHLLTLEKKALKWFGKKIPYAYFGIKLPEKLSKWSHKDIDHDGMTDLTNNLQSEIDLIEKGMYNLSEQVKGDLGLMLPKTFLEARKEAIEKGLLEENEAKDIIVVDDESVDVDLDGLGPEFLN